MITLKTIEEAGERATRTALERLDGSYLETYGIHNPWVAWLLRQPTAGWNLTQRRQRALCGWADDSEPDSVPVDWG